jgi:excisionase family DNA binding protein
MPCRTSKHRKALEEEARLLKEQVEAEWVDYPTAERYSGLSQVTLWRRVKGGELKAARVGRRVRIHLPSLREFMEQHAAEGSAD